MKKAYSLMGLCLLLVLTSLLLSCGGGGGATTATISSVTTTQGGGQTTTQGTTEPTDVTFTTAASSTFDDIPLYSGARPVSGDFSGFTQGFSGSSGGVNVEWHFYEIDASDVNAAQDFYRDAMPDNGWQSIMETALPEMQGNYLMYMKGDGTTSAIIMTFTDPDNSLTILGLCRTSM
jgi:hypothetical protein